MLFTEPAIDIVGRGIVGRGHLRRVAQPRARRPGVRRRAAGQRAARGDRDPRRGPDPRACSPSPATRCSPPPTASGSAEALDGLDFMAAVDIYLNETTRHADVVLPPTTALERDQYDLVFHTFAVRNTARFTPAGASTSPRARCTTGRSSARSRCASAGAAATRKKPLRQGARRAGRGCRSAPPRWSPGCCSAGRAYDAAGAARRSPRASTSARCARRMPDRLQTRDKRIHLAPDLVVADLRRLRAGARRAAAGDDELVLIGRRHQRDNNSWMHNSARLTRGKPRHQLLMHPDDLAARGLADGAAVRDHLAGRHGHHRGAGDRRHDARRGLAAPRLRPPGRRHPAGQRRQGRRRLDQRPHRPRPARRLRQRRAQRRPRDGRARPDGRLGGPTRPTALTPTCLARPARPPAASCSRPGWSAGCPTSTPPSRPLYADPAAVRDRLVLLAARRYAARADDLHALDLRALAGARLVPAARAWSATRPTPTGSPAPWPGWPSGRRTSRTWGSATCT